MKPCLCYASNIDLKDIIKDNTIGFNEKIQLLEEKIRECITTKPKAHAFEDLSKVSEIKDMVEIGG